MRPGRRGAGKEPPRHQASHSSPLHLQQGIWGHPSGQEGKGPVPRDVPLPSGPSSRQPGNAEAHEVAPRNPSVAPPQSEDGRGRQPGLPSWPGWRVASSTSVQKHWSSVAGKPVPRGLLGTASVDTAQFRGLGSGDPGATSLAWSTGLVPSLSQRKSWLPPGLRTEPSPGWPHRIPSELQAFRARGLPRRGPALSGPSCRVPQREKEPCPPGPPDAAPSLARAAGHLRAPRRSRLPSRKEQGVPGRKDVSAFSSCTRWAARLQAAAAVQRRGAGPRAAATLGRRNSRCGLFSFQCPAGWAQLGSRCGRCTPQTVPEWKTCISSKTLPHLKPNLSRVPLRSLGPHSPPEQQRDPAWGRGRWHRHPASGPRCQDRGAAGEEPPTTGTWAWRGPHSTSMENQGGELSLRTGTPAGMHRGCVPEAGSGA